MSTTITPAIPAKIRQLETDLMPVVLERKQELHTAGLALIGRQHHFTLGLPGIAKSLMVEEIIKRISDVSYFDFLMTRQTEPGEVFGGLNVKRLSEEGVMERVVTGMLPEVSIAFLDEIFKANSAILNALLRAINERRFNMGSGKVIDIPLHTVFAASNELAESDELAALWDRLHFRHHVDPLQERSNFANMLRLDIDPDPQPIISMQELEQAYAESSKIEIPDEVISATLDLKDQLAGESLFVSDRRWREAMRVIRSEAYYNGHPVAEISDMRPLAHVLWSKPDDIKVVRRLVWELANPLDKEAQEYLDRLTEAYEQYLKQLKEAENKTEEASHSVQMYKKMSKAKEKYKALRDAQVSPSDVIDELGTKITKVGNDLLTKLGHED